MSAEEVTKLADPAAVARAAAERFRDCARESVERSGRFIAVLAGGSTPRALYELLAGPEFADQLPWSETTLLFGDERCVEPQHERSNYRMVRESLLEPLSLAQRQVLRMEGERKPEEAAVRYQLRLRDLFPGRVSPRFDLLLLGMGADGHTASLFPGTEALQETRRWVAANYVPQQQGWRLTLTFPALCSARRVLFLITGSEKAPVVARAFGGVAHPESYPCERVIPVDGTREVLVDGQAAAELERGRGRERGQT